jgi:hypothetical protein
MDFSSKRYVVERLGAADDAWRPLTACASLDYARLIAGTGIRRRIGISYRVIDRGTGADVPFGGETGVDRIRLAQC